MESGIRADTALVRQHSAYILENQLAAKRLTEQLQEVRRYAGPAERQRCEQIIRKAENLYRYFREMAELVERMGADLEHASRYAGNLLEETRRTAQARSGGIFAADDEDDLAL